jgi:hypothetical protein
MIPDRTGRFPERPHWEIRELEQQTHDERLVEAANALARHRASEMANGFRRQNGTKSVAERPSIALRQEKKLSQNQ